MRAWFGTVMTRELRALRREVEAYPRDADLWRSAPGIANPGGSLVLHLTGNLRHFVGAVLGGPTYRRDRDAEFSRRDVPRAELLAEVDAALTAVAGGLARASDADLTKPYPQAVGGMTPATGLFLTHLAVHLGYHLGQLDYHRRLVTGEAATVGALPIAELTP